MWMNQPESHCANVSNNVSPSANHARNGGRYAGLPIGDQISVTAAPIQYAMRIARKTRATRRSVERGKVVVVEPQARCRNVLLFLGDAFAHSAESHAVDDEVAADRDRPGCA